MPTAAISSSRKSSDPAAACNHTSFSLYHILDRRQEERVEIHGVAKRTRSGILKQMLEELAAVKKESLAAIEEIEEYTVKKEADVEEELAGGLERHGLEREEISVRCKKGKRKEQAPVTAGGHPTKTYHAAVYRASFQPSATRRSKTYSASGKQSGKGAAAAMSNDGGRMRREGKEKANISGTVGNGERRTRQRKYHGVTNVSRDGGADTYLEKVKGKEKVVGMKVKTEPVVEEDDTRGLATHVLGREEISVVSQKRKGKQQCPIIAAGQERRRYQQSGYRASFQPCGSRSNGGSERLPTKLKGKEKSVGRKSAPNTVGMKEESWTRLVDNPVKLRNNVLSIPRAVIRACIHGKIERIKLMDRDQNVPYYCQMTKRDDTVDRYIFGGWSDFCKERNIQKGDTLCFCIRHPPVEEISVAVQRGKP